MARELRYDATRRALRQILAGPGYSAGTLLPSEAELAASLGVSRVTLRRALTSLKEDGVVDSRQGFGWFVAGDPLRQSLNRLASLDVQIEAGARSARRELLTFELTRPPDWVRRHADSEQMLHIVRLNYADEEPIGRNSAWAPADLCTDISLGDAAQRSLHQLLPVTLATATQVISAVAAADGDVDLLRVPLGSPLLCARRITRDADARVVIVSESVYNPLRTEYVVELTANSENSSQLRLLG